jgi:cyclophilin family peptidyl-prolyl cis-trans isomerase
MNTKFTKEQRDTYVEIGGAPHLDAQYTVFGEIIEGYDVIDKIAGVETNDKDRPVEDVKIIKITVVE